MNLPAQDEARPLSALGWIAPLALLTAPAVALALTTGPLGLVGLAAAVAGTALLCLRVHAARRELGRHRDDGRRHCAQLEALVDAAADAILTCDESGLIRDANHAAGRLFGRRREDLPGRPLSLLLPGAALSSVDTNQHQVLGAAAAIEGHRKDGTTFPVSVALSKVRLEGEGLYAVIIHDQSELTRARGEAEALSRAKSAFLLSVSHELRTPLNGILGVADLLAATPLDDRQRQLVETLAGSGEAMLTAVEQVLEHSRLEAGQLRLECDVFSPAAVLAEVERVMAARAAAKGLQFSVHAEVPERLLGDGRRLRQIVECLADSAIKATPAGAVEVRASAQGAAVTLSVRDAGPRAGDVSLGVSLAAQLARLMGGRLGAEDAAGHGNTFRVQLPFERPGGPPPPAVAALVALADAAERAAIESLLRDLGLAPVGVPTGRAALAEVLRGVVRGQPFGFVVLDEALADMPAEDWVRQVGECSGWSGPVVLLHDGPSGGGCPAGVAAVIRRFDAHDRLGEWVRGRLSAARPRA